jgi:hypothetical protein
MIRITRRAANPALMTRLAPRSASIAGLAGPTGPAPEIANTVAVTVKAAATMKPLANPIDPRRVAQDEASALVGAGVVVINVTLPWRESHKCP